MKKRAKKIKIPEVFINKTKNKTKKKKKNMNHGSLLFPTFLYLNTA